MDSVSEPSSSDVGRYEVTLDQDGYPVFTPLLDTPNRRPIISQPAGATERKMVLLVVQS